MYFGMYDSAQHFISSNPDTFGQVPVTLSTFACGSIGALPFRAASRCDTAAPDRG